MSIPTSINSEIPTPMGTWSGNFLLETSDVDLARLGHEEAGLSLDIEGTRSKDFRCKTRGVVMDEYSIYYKKYGAPTRLSAPPTADYWLSIPVAHSFDKTGRTTLKMTGRPIRIACPGNADHIVLLEGAEGLGIHFSESALSQRLSELTLKEVSGTIVFESGSPIEGALQQAIGSLAVMAAHSPDDWSPMTSSIYRASLADAISSAILLNAPHSHCHLLEEPTPSENFAVRRAIDYIHSNLDQPVRLSDLTAATGIPARTLSYQFNRRMGCSPMAYMRRARLAMARTRLQRGSATSIIQIALELGFNNAGRFSGEYKRCFGETPSQTRAACIRSAKFGHSERLSQAIPDGVRQHPGRDGSGPSRDGDLTEGSVPKVLHDDAAKLNGI